MERELLIEKIRAFKKGKCSAPEMLYFIQQYRSYKEISMPHSDHPESAEEWHIQESLTPELNQSQKGDVPSVEVEDNNLLKGLQQMLSQLLKLEESDVSLSNSFLDLGLDSISATNFAQAIDQRYGISIAPTVLFEFSTLQKLDSFLRENYARELAGTIEVSEVNKDESNVGQNPQKTPSREESRPEGSKTFQPHVEFLSTQSDTAAPLNDPYPSTSNTDLKAGLQEILCQLLRLWMQP